MKRVDEQNIILERELNELDKFVLRFIHILEKHTPYVLVSGYVALLFGRSRATEDVDMFIERIDKETFHKLYEELLQQGFWALNANDENELYAMLRDNLAIRFADNEMVIPNMEVKFVKDTVDRLTLSDKMRVHTSGGVLLVSHIELQIAYKRFVLKSEKDFEDALYLQKLFEISEEKINKYKDLLKRYDRL